MEMTSTAVPRAPIFLRPRATAAILMAVVLALPMLPVPGFWITLGNYIGLYSLVALGLVLVTGIGGLTSFGQAAFVGLGAYATAYMTTALQMSPWAGLLTGLLVSGAAAAVIGSVTVRLSGHFLPLATIAWALSLYYLFGNLEFLGKFDGIAGIPPLQIGGVDLVSPRAMYGVIWVTVVVCLALSLNLLNSRVGRAIRALAKGSTMPEAMGIHTANYKLLVFVIAALLSSLSGWLYAHLQRSVSATPFGLNMGIEYLFMAVVGGIGYVWGAVIGAAVLTIVKSQLQHLLPSLLGSDGNYEMLVFGVLLTLLLHRARSGLWPWIAARWAHVSPPEPSVVAPASPPPGYTAFRHLDRRKVGSPLLSVKKVVKRFGGLVAVNGVEFKVAAGEIVGLIGPNGAGKSTMFNLVSGVLPASEGEVEFKGMRIDKLGARRIASLGMGRSFQHVHLIPTLSVLENIAIGAHMRGRSGAVTSALRLNRAEEQRLLYLAAQNARRVGLGDHLDDQAGSLALGQQRLLEIARALCTAPELLLLDEPAAGLRLQEKEALAVLLHQLRQEGTSVLIVEHDMDFVMGLCDRLVVMEFGKKIAEGEPAAIQQNEAVLAAYLGGIE